MGKGPEQTLLQGGHTDGQQIYEKMLNITNHQRNAKQNHSDTSPHTWRKGNPSTLLVGMQTGATTVENNMEFPQKTKIGTAF